MPKLSFVVPTHNRIEWLPICLQSILSQTVEDIEIIVVDDASTDGTKEFLDTWAFQFPNIKVIHNETNQGGGKSRNIGCEAAASDIIVVCDDDDFCVNTRGEDILEWFEKHPESEMVNFPYVSVNYFDEVMEEFRGVPFDHETFLKQGAVSYYCNPGSAHKKKSIQEIGGFPSEKEGLTDDYQMITNWVKAGKKIDFCAERNGGVPFATGHRLLPNSMMSQQRGFDPQWVTA